MNRVTLVEPVLLWVVPGILINYSTNSIRLHPWYIIGITDAEGCFNVIIARSSTNKIGWRVPLHYV